LISYFLSEQGEHMLLRHTPKEIVEREALTIQPAKTCQPIGAMYAALGIHRCLPHSHGSQGCCAYHRSALTRHYKEPVMAATSSFTEGSSVFGGQANLTEALTNIFTIYNPDIVAVHTTCLSETIGDDVGQIIAKAYDEGRIPKGKYAIKASTPSYVGSHVIGFANMIKGIVDAFAVPGTTKSNHVNIVPGFVEPSDMSEIKRIAAMMGVPVVLLTDTSEVLNTPQTGKYEMYPKGGTTIDALKTIGSAKATLGLGLIASGPGAKLIDTKCKVPCEILKLPIGLRATDAFVDALRKFGGIVPDELEVQRGQLLDMITDMQQYFAGKKVALVGDPDQLIALGEFLTDLGMVVTAAVTGTQGKKFITRMKEVTKNDALIAKDMSDMYYVHQLILNEPVDLIFGNSYAKYMSRDLGIPLIRTGFPIYDRVGHQYFPTLGYAGAMRLTEKILNALLDKQDATALEEKFELVM
jgi:nitrogenase molybdenum-iron protein beta chain